MMKLFNFISWNKSAQPSRVITYPMDLNEQQTESLKQLRARVDHLLPEQLKPDYDLVRWLVARNFDIDKAESMLKDSLEWRKKWDVDNIDTYDAPEILTKYMAVGKSGYDKEGYPVWIVPYGSSDGRGILQSAPFEDFIKYTIKTLEMGPKMRDLRVKGDPDVVYRQSAVIDLDCFSFRHIIWKPTVDAVIEMVQIYECNYPENLRRAYIINTPLMFKLFFAALKPFIAVETMKKIKIFGSKGWKEAILEDIPADQLPVHYGGTMRDPDGNPKCLTKICYGGEVPKSMYVKNRPVADKLSDCCKTVSISTGCKEVVELHAAEKGCKICWTIDTGTSEVAFGIHGADNEVVLPVHPMKTNNTVEEGSIICEESGTYYVCMTNKSKLWTVKNIRQNIRIEKTAS